MRRVFLSAVPAWPPPEQTTLEEHGGLSEERVCCAPSRSMSKPTLHKIACGAGHNGQVQYVYYEALRAKLRQQPADNPFSAVIPPIANEPLEVINPKPGKLQLQTK
jgi:hypothetical protein